MGGNFKLGISVNQQSKWLTQADSIIARYRAGARLYTIKDALLGNGTLEIEILALADGEGFILKLKARISRNQQSYIGLLEEQQAKSFPEMEIWSRPRIKLLSTG
jgi:hypothetical protein